MDAPVVYVVRFWVAPETEQELIDWIDNGHLQEVVDQPGFLWGRRLTLDDRDGQGWQGHRTVSGLSGMSALWPSHILSIQWRGKRASRLPLRGQ